MNLPPLFVIAGATATGKTGLSIAVARALAAEGVAAEIISADSRQVYRGLDIGTAKASVADRASVPHHGIDLVEPDEPFTLADFAAHAREALVGIAARGGIAILVGGTGLYLRAVARGIDTDALPSDAILRASLENDLERDGLEPLVGRLQAAAPRRAARTDLKNPRRVVRALEIAELEGDRDTPLPRGYDGPTRWIGLSLDPDTHRAWIATRARAQFDAGLVEEARVATGALRPDAACVLRDRLQGGVGGPRRDDDRGGGDRRGRAPQRRLREAPANVVPLGARDRVARRR